MFEHPATIGRRERCLSPWRRLSACGRTSNNTTDVRKERIMGYPRQGSRRWAFGGAAVAALAFACGAQAQVQGEGNATTTGATAGGGEALEEIVVTAEKRESTIQRTPIAVTAVTNDTLTRQGVNQLSNLEKVVPDVKLTRQGAGMTVAVRGVYSTDNSPTSEAAVSVHVDGAYLAKTNGLQGFLFDLERIEVLKGPQGTLYGRNANGGTINIITNKPAIGVKEAGGEFEYGTHDTLRTSGYANVPIGDTLAVRLAFQTLSHNGYMKSGLDDANEQSGRIGIRWRPNEKNSLWIVGDYSKLGNKGDGTFNVVKVSPGTNFFLPPDERDDRFYNTDTASRKAEVFKRDAINKGITAQYDYNFDFATWTTELAYRKFDSEPVNPNNIGQGAVINGFPQSARNYVPQHFESKSVETRLTSATSTPLQWVVGLYGFLNEDSGTMIGYGSLRATTPSIQIANPYEKAKSGAVFGQATYTPAALPGLHLIAGARYTVDKKQAEDIFTQFGTGPFAAGPSDFENKWDAFTYKLGLSYDLTDRNMIYANYSTGYKAGGFAYGPGVNAAAGPIYAPEKIKAWEVGSKNRFLDNRLQINIEGFRYKYRDYQTNVTLFGPGPLPVLTVGSAGQAIYKGAAVDVQFAMTPSDTLKAYASVVDAKYGEFVINAPTGFTISNRADTTLVRTGQHITGVPQWTANGSWAHTFDLGSGTLNAEVLMTIRGPTAYSNDLDPLFGRVITRDSAWSTFNLSARYEPRDADWNLTVYARNVANDTHWVQGAYSATTHLTSAAFNDPRVIGFIFGAKFQ
jgi:iron complex outermembrane receptor protein